MLTVALLCACGSAGAVLASGCGAAHEDAHEPRGSFTVRVTRASFSTHQAIARPEQLVLNVRNEGTRALPNIAIAIDSFSYTSNYPNLASRERPVWVIDEGPGPKAPHPVETQQVDPPGGGPTATLKVWALGGLAAGASRSFVWHVTPVKSGVHTISYRVYAGLNGKAVARLANGAPPTGHFTVDIASRPPQNHVNPQTGRVTRGAFTPSAD